jgi:hypothetical protein
MKLRTLDSDNPLPMSKLENQSSINPERNNPVMLGIESFYFCGAVEVYRKLLIISSAMNHAEEESPTFSSSLSR